MSKGLYLAICRIMHSFTSKGGVIFGGAVRDTILHDLAAKDFYKNGGTNESYDDPTSEWNDRFVTPNDIDCYILRHNFDKFLKIAIPPST